MKILIVAATRLEIRPLADKFALVHREDENFAHYQYRNDKVDILITGIGMAPMSYYLGKQLHVTKYDIVLNAGICGSYSGSLPVGTVVNVTEESFCELGAENNEEFITVFDLGLMDPEEPPYMSGKLHNNTTLHGDTLRKLRRVRGTTASTIHGNSATIGKIREIYDPDVESMEGAAFFYACLVSKIPFHQVRSISNFVEERDKSKWDIPLAVANLNAAIFEIIKEQKTN